MSVLHRRPAAQARGGASRNPYLTAVTWPYDIRNVKLRVLEMDQIMEAERLNAVSNHIGDLKSREQELRRYL